MGAGGRQAGETPQIRHLNPRDPAGPPGGVSEQPLSPARTVLRENLIHPAVAGLPGIGYDAARHALPPHDPPCDRP